MTPEQLRELTESAKDTINYAFGEPMVAISKEDALALASQIPVTAAQRDVIDERQRQVTSECFSVDHDDGHGARELARAASAYIQHYFERCWLLGDKQSAGDGRYYTYDPPPDCWPWEAQWWKPKDPRRDLVRAVALLIAEIERLDRAGKA